MSDGHDQTPSDSEHPQSHDAANPERRAFLKGVMGTMGALAVTTGVVEPLRALKDMPTLEEFLRDHYSELSPDDIDDVMSRVEARIAEEYQTKVRVGDYHALDGVEFAYALNLSRCNGSRRCVEACMKENNIPPDHPEMAYIRVMEMNNDSLDLEDGTPLYDHEQVPAEAKYYMPISCHQCRNPPCTKVCPVQATWTEPDGITVIDYNWCIGCRCCMAACPYEARRFNWTKPQLKPEQINPDMGYLSNRIRPRGVVEKCHFCLHRTRRGLNPACMEVCPTGARVFGNLLDPEGKINYILKTKRVFVLKAEARTIPRFYYFFEK